VRFRAISQARTSGEAPAQGLRVITAGVRGSGVRARRLGIANDGFLGRRDAGRDARGSGGELVSRELATGPPFAEGDHLRAWLGALESQRAEHREELLVAADHDTDGSPQKLRQALLRSRSAVCTRRYRWLAMRDRLAITFALDGERLESTTRLVRSGPYVLVLQTVLPQTGLAVELHSTFVGHAAVRTRATHLLLGPVGQPPSVVTREDESGIIDPVERPDSCVYAHCHELIELLAERGLHVAVAELPSRPVPLPE